MIKNFNEFLNEKNKNVNKIDNSSINEASWLNMNDYLQDPYKIAKYDGTDIQHELYGIITNWMVRNLKFNKNKSDTSWFFKDILGFKIIKFGDADTACYFIEKDKKDAFLKVINDYKNSKQYIYDSKTYDNSRPVIKKENPKDIERLKKEWDFSKVKALTEKQVISIFGEEALDYEDEWYPKDGNDILINELKGIVKEWNKRFGTNYIAEEDLMINIDNELQNRTSLAFIDFIF